MRDAIIDLVTDLIIRDLGTVSIHRSRFGTRRREMVGYLFRSYIADYFARDCLRISSHLRLRCSRTTETADGFLVPGSSGGIVVGHFDRSATHDHGLSAAVSAEDRTDWLALKSEQFGYCWRSL